MKKDQFIDENDYDKIMKSALFCTLQNRQTRQKIIKSNKTRSI